MFSKHQLLYLLILSFSSSFLFAESIESPAGDYGGNALPLIINENSSGLIETSYDEDWGLALSDLILRKNVYNYPYYEKVFEPYYLTDGISDYNRYFKLTSCSQSGQVIDMSTFGVPGTLDSLFVRDGFSFQLYDASGEPYGPLMVGPHYVSLDHWAPWYEFEPDTFFVEGDAGGLVNYSIAINSNPVNFRVEASSSGECLVPNSSASYSLLFDPDGCDLTDLTITSELPEEVDYFMAIPGTGQLAPDGRSYTWDNVDIIGYDPNDLTIVVFVNEKARPQENYEIVFKVENNSYYYELSVRTDICSCDYYPVLEPIRVDIDSTALAPDGLTWQTAFTDLQEAIFTANPCDDIWVAEGLYKPADSDPNITFYVKALRLYGGFEGNEVKQYERNWYEEETILSGDINGDDDGTDAKLKDNFINVVTIADANSISVVDGFTITGGSSAGVYLNDAAADIGHNKITNNITGINLEKANESFVKNNWIYGNNDGVIIKDSQETNELHNLTVVKNSNSGITNTGVLEPNITNSIFWGNHENSDLVGCYPTYSLMLYPKTFYDLSDPNNPIMIGFGEGNLGGDPNDLAYNNPLFEDYENNNFLLDTGSPCIDAGDPNGVYNGQKDIDGHFRVLGSRVDIGADEDCDDTPSDADYNDDGIVNYLDYAILSDAWLTSKYMSDLLELANDWLWMSCDYMKTAAVEEVYMSATSTSMSIPMSVEAAVSEPTVEEQVAQAEDNIAFLESIWKKDKEIQEQYSQEYWDEFIGSIESWIDELESGF